MNEDRLTFPSMVIGGGIKKVNIARSARKKNKKPHRFLNLESVAPCMEIVA